MSPTRRNRRGNTDYPKEKVRCRLTISRNRRLLSRTIMVIHTATRRERRWIGDLRQTRLSWSLWVGLNGRASISRTGCKPTNCPKRLLWPKTAAAGRATDLVSSGSCRNELRGGFDLWTFL